MGGGVRIITGRRGSRGIVCAHILGRLKGMWTRVRRAGGGWTPKRERDILFRGHFVIAFVNSVSQRFENAAREFVARAQLWE